MSKRTWLAAGLLGVMSLGGAAFAQDAKPAAAAPSQEERLKGVAGTYKGEMPGTPSIILTVKDGQLTMEAVGTGFPPFPITLTDKDELTAPFLPPGFKFTIQRDKDGKATGIKAVTPQGNGELKRQSGDAKPVEEKKADVPDILGVYEPDDTSLGVPKAELVYEKGKLVIKSEGQPDRVVTSTKDDLLVLDPAIEGVQKIKLVRDKDGKVIGSEVTSDQGTLKFTRKTFPRPPGAEEAGKIPDVLGKYESDIPESPIPSGEMTLEKGQLVLRTEGQADVPVKIDKDGNLLSDKFPDGVTAKLRKDKDGKVIGIDAETPLGKIGFTRKTFVKPPTTDEAKPDDKKLARIKEAAGTYKSDIPDLPVVTMKVKDGKLMIQAAGNPEIEVKLGDDDTLKGDMLPDGFKLKLTRDKDGKITGMNAETPMGTADFKFTPEKA